MAGLLTHLSIAFVGFLVGTFIFKNYKYGLAFVFGQFIPDLISFGITGTFEKSLNPSIIMTNKLFGSMVFIGHTFLHWVIFGLIVFVIIFILYNLKKISKKTYKTLFVILIFFLIGITIHLVLDMLIIEASYWI